MSGANTRGVQARFCNNNWKRGNDFVKICHVKKYVWEREGSASPHWMTRWDLVNGTMILREAICEEKHCKSFENKFGQVVENSSDLIFCLFGFVRATKFRDSSEFSECVQNVSVKSCLPSQCLYVNKCTAKKIMQRAKRPRNEFSPTVLHRTGK